MTEKEEEGEIKEEEIKLVIVGDGGIGKTSLIHAFCNGYFPESFANIHENYSYVEKYNDKEVTVQIWDTMGQEDYDELRSLSYTGTQVFLAGFSLDCTESFEHIKTKWIPEIRKHLESTRKNTGMDSKVPILLVGLRRDLRDDVECKTPVSNEQGTRVAEELKLDTYMECSAKKMSGMKEVFRKAVQCVYENRKGLEGGDGCSIL